MPDELKSLPDRLSEFSETMIESYRALYRVRMTAQSLFGLEWEDAEIVQGLIECHQLQEPLVDQWNDVSFWFTAGHLELCRIAGEVSYPELKLERGSSLHDAMVKSHLKILWSLGKDHEAPETIAKSRKLQDAIETGDSGLLTSIVSSDREFIRNATRAFVDIDAYSPELDLELVQSCLVAIRYGANGSERGLQNPAIHSPIKKAIFKLLEKTPQMNNETLQARTKANAGQVRTYKHQFFELNPDMKPISQRRKT